MPIISAEPIQAQIYRMSFMVCQGVIENVTVSPDGTYSIYYVKNGKLVNATGKVVNVVQNRRAPDNSYILFDYSLDNSSRRERILFSQIQMIKDVTPNDAYNIALKHGFVGTEEEWLISLKGTPGASAYELAVEAGFDGTVEDYLKSLRGEKGESAYDIARAYGFVGTEQEWLLSLRGRDGKSAYDVAVESGFVGTEDEWMATLIGEDGKSAYDMAVERGFTGTEDEWLASVGAPDQLHAEVQAIGAEVDNLSEKVAEAEEKVIEVTKANMWVDGMGRP